MFGSNVLDVTIGIVSVYLLLALMCSAINELIARALALRATTLEDGIRTLLQGNRLNDPVAQKLVESLYNHPLIQGLSMQGKFDQLVNRPGRPSYIPSATFALALLDTFSPPDRTGGPAALLDIRTSVANLPDVNAKKALLTLIDNANGDLKVARANLEAWFNDSMDRVSGWYTRKIQLVLLVMALALSVALNADTLVIANGLNRDPALRTAVVAAAQEQMKGSLSTAEKNDSLARIATVQTELGNLQVPLGWSSPVPSNPSGWLMKLAGWLLTGFAVSLGAPVWFDVLSRITNIRSAGNQPVATPARLPP